MSSPDQEDKNRFIYATSRYYGEFKPENLVFHANLQEFSHRVSYITSFQTAGKLSPEEAYKQIRILWKQLKASKKNLRIGSSGEFP